MLYSFKTSLISPQQVRGRIFLNYLCCLVQVPSIRVHALCNDSPSARTNSSSDSPTSKSSSASDIQCVSLISDVNFSNEAS